MVKKEITKRTIKRYVVDYLEFLRDKKKLPIWQAYLFGSHAHGNPRAWSDIDVAVVSSKFKGKVDPYEYLWLSLRDVDVKRGLEPVGFSPKEFQEEDALIHEIKQFGIRIM